MFSQAPRPFRTTSLLAGFAASLLLFFACLRSSNAQIFADFETTQGSFTIEFFHQTQPIAVANFIGLADGSLPWLDSDTKKVMTAVPYFDGIKFHRVIKGFMCQGGSPNGRGTDGPGYFFKDHFARTKAGDLLHPHDRPGLISMANSGINTNGSQFFIIADPDGTPWLDGLHVVFGDLSAGPFGTREEGLAVVEALNCAPTTGNVPDEDQVMISITIRRVGAEAEAFDVRAQGLPILCELQGELNIDPSGAGIAELSYLKTRNSQVDVYHGNDLQTWDLLDSTFFPDTTTEAEDISALLSTDGRQFFRINKIDYSPHPHPGGPESLAGATFRLNFDDIFNIDITIDETGADGTWNRPDGGGSGTLESVDYVVRPAPFVDSATVFFEGLIPDNPFVFGMRLDFSFDTATSGRFDGPTNGSPSNISGTFEFEP